MESNSCGPGNLKNIDYIDFCCVIYWISLDLIALAYAIYF